MITSVRLTNFKNFADETLKLGPFTVIVGANASGKSNIRDAFRFLHGIGRGYTLAEIIGGKIGVGGQLEWGAIRGAPNALGRSSGSITRSQSPFRLVIDVRESDSVEHYTVGVGIETTLPFEPQLNHEELVDDEEIALMTINIRKPSLLTARTRYSGPNELPSATFANLAGMRFFEFDPSRMKLPAVPGSSLGDYGENLAAVLQKICLNPERKDSLTSWIRELTPMDVHDFDFPVDPYGRIYLRIIEANQREFPVDSISDGTLRFLATLAALLAEETAKVYFFEEIDTGIHPSRLPLLVDLIETQTKRNGCQVVTTTHSPALLDVLSDESFENTSIVYRDEESEDSIIRRLADLSIASELRKTQGLARLHATGWMENVLSFEHDPEEKAAPVT